MFDKLFTNIFDPMYPEHTVLFFIAIIAGIVSLINLLRSLKNAKRKKVSQDSRMVVKNRNFKKGKRTMLAQFVAKKTMAAFGWTYIDTYERAQSNAINGKVYDYNVWCHYYARSKSYKRGIFFRLFEFIANITLSIRPIIFRLLFVSSIVGILFAILGQSDVLGTVFIFFNYYYILPVISFSLFAWIAVMVVNVISILGALLCKMIVKRDATLTAGQYETVFKIIARMQKDAGIEQKEKRRRDEGRAEEQQKKLDREAEEKRRKELERARQNLEAQRQNLEKQMHNANRKFAETGHAPYVDPEYYDKANEEYQKLLEEDDDIDALKTEKDKVDRFIDDYNKQKQDEEWDLNH